MPCTCTTGHAFVSICRSQNNERSYRAQIHTRLWIIAVPSAIVPVSRREDFPLWVCIMVFGKVLLQRIISDQCTKRWQIYFWRDRIHKCLRGRGFLHDGEYDDVFQRSIWLNSLGSVLGCGYEAECDPRGSMWLCLRDGSRSKRSSVVRKSEVVRFDPEFAVPTSLPFVDSLLTAIQRKGYTYSTLAVPLTFLCKD